MNETKMVQAIAIDYHHIYTLCCNDKCTHHIHEYDSNQNLNDRMEIVFSHCLEDQSEIIIRVDKTTLRSKLNYYKNNKSMSFSKKDFKRQKKKIDEKAKKDLEIKYRSFLAKEPLKVYFD